MHDADDIVRLPDGNPYLRQVEPGLRRGTLRPLDPRCECVQFNRELSERDYRRLAAWLEDYPGVTLRVYGAPTDLEFLRFFPTLRKFQVDARYGGLESIEGLRHLRPDAHTLALGATSKRFSLAPLARFTDLRRLSLDGHTKDFEVVSGLTSLVSLTLRSVTLPDLSPLVPLTRLRALDLKLGGTRDLGALPSVGALEYLELWMVRGLADLGPVANLPHLRYLYLQSLRQVTALPSLTRAERLDRVWLENLKGLRDLTPLLTAPALTDLALVDMRHLQPDDVGVLAGHPSLRRMITGLGSERKNNEVRRLVPLPDSTAFEPPEVLRGD